MYFPNFRKKFLLILSGCDIASLDIKIRSEKKSFVLGSRDVFYSGSINVDMFSSLFVIPGMVSESLDA